MRDIKEYAQLIHLVFNNPQGQELLKELVATFHDRTAYNPECRGLDLAFAEGQRDIILHLKQYSEADADELNDLINQTGDDI